ncbi:MAG: tripartite tricarboxylate transporter permease [Syntrophales bacterium]
MDMVLSGLAMVLQPANFLYMLGGTFVGIIFAAMPGINGLTCAVLFIPFTYYLGIIPSLIVLCAMYQGSNFGGSITAVLLNIPGDPAAICTTFDGHPMAKQGKAGKAIGAALFASSLGGIIGGVILVTVGPAVAEIAMKMGSAEIFMFIFFGLTTIASIAGSSLLSGFISMFLGLLIASIGISPVTGSERFVFGSSYLLGGIDFVVAIMGLFALTEVFYRHTSDTATYSTTAFNDTRSELPSWAEIKENLKMNIPRSSIIGVIVGAIPAAGATIAAIVSYGVAKQFSKHPEKFGTGIIEGVFAPESANNACAAGAVMTMLTLGIPGSATTAIILGAFLIAGVEPGPMIFVTNPEIVQAAFGSMLLCNIAVFFLGVFLTRFFVKAMSLPLWILDPMIVIFSYLGVFSIRNSFADVIIMTLFGILGYVMRRMDISVGPLMLALVLGPIAEKSFVTAMRISDTGLMIFVTSPVSLILLILSLLSLFIPLGHRYWGRIKAAIA